MQTIAGPSTVDGATYFISTTVLVQLAVNSALSYLPYSATDKTASSSAKWTPIAALYRRHARWRVIVGRVVFGCGDGGGAKSMVSSSGSAPAPSRTGTVMRQVAWGSGVVMALVAVGLSLL
ncbi:hypothetical protein B0H14DRAFT_3457340 [Mycena olivaceomarginata]|nr:hypothetical protein B0H14DRAFT_3457340 [Mycena olivaceomarginata]